jgi:hypothetical protein
MLAGNGFSLLELAFIARGLWRVRSRRTRVGVATDVAMDGGDLTELVIAGVTFVNALLRPG